MEEQLVSFKTAKLAKEKGFGVESIESVNSQIYDNHTEVSKFPYYVDSFSLWELEELQGEVLYLAPTQSLLQKWLREKYNIQLCLKPIYGGGKINGRQIGWMCYTPYQDEEFNKLPSISLSHNTYGGALERGLQAALKL